MAVPRFLRRASMRQPDDPGDTDPQPRPAVPVPWNDRAIWQVGDEQVGLCSEKAAITVGSFVFRDAGQGMRAQDKLLASEHLAT